MELPPLNIVYAVLPPVLRFVFPSVWGSTDGAGEQGHGTTAPDLRVGVPYFYNDRRSLYLDHASDRAGQLRIVVHQARNLRLADADGHNEPFAKVILGQRVGKAEMVGESAQTEIVQETTELGEKG